MRPTLQYACLLWVLATVANAYTYSGRRSLSTSFRSHSFDSICYVNRKKSFASHSSLRYTVSRSIKQLNPKKENKFLKALSNLWSVSIGWLISNLLYLFRSILGRGKADKTDIDEKIETIKEIAESEAFLEPEEVGETVISVTVTNEFEDEQNVQPKSLDKKQLAAARKVVERKLEELKKIPSPKVPVATASVIESSISETTKTAPVVEISTVTPSLSSAASPSASVIEAAETLPTENETKAENILNSFPAVVSEKTDDHTYMSYRFGAVDPYAVFGSTENSRRSTSTSLSAVSEDLPLIAAESASESEDDSWSKVKKAGTSGIIAYTLTELSFWATVPLLVIGYQYFNNAENLDLSDPAQQTTIFGLSAGFLTFARLAVPARIALALALTPYVDKTITRKFLDGSSVKNTAVVQATESNQTP